MIMETASLMFNILVYPGILFMLAGSILLYGILRKLAARMQSRIGPPILQPLYDTLKLFGKNSIIPEQAKVGFRMWPVVALTCMLVAGLMTPIAGITVLDFSGGIFLLIYFLVFGALAMYLAGFASSNPYGVIGSMRGVIQMIGYEFPFIASVLVPVIALTTLSPSSINWFQLQAGLPWMGMVFPFAAAGYFISVMAKTEIPPFHIPDAHQEIVTGYSTEYSGFPLAALELSRMVKLFVLSALGVALFLGGSSAGLPGFAIFIAKVLGIVVMLTVFRTIFSRVRIDHAVKICWIAGLVVLIDIARVLIF